MARWLLAFGRSSSESRREVRDRIEPASVFVSAVRLAEVCSAWAELAATALTGVWAPFERVGVGVSVVVVVVVGSGSSSGGVTEV